MDQSTLLLAFEHYKAGTLDVDASVSPVRVKADEGSSMLIPALKIRDFTFTSLSDAV